MIQDNVIPVITDPLGRHWEQPPLSEILVDNTHALMAQHTFDKLPEYSATVPTGVYNGKMWKRHNGVFDKQFLAQGGKPEWLLMWYGPSTDPECCSNNARKILLL